MMVFRDWSI